jgi:hypothetical protein
LVESPIYTNPPYKANIPLAVEFYYLGRFTSVLLDHFLCLPVSSRDRVSFRQTLIK